MRTLHGDSGADRGVVNLQKFSAMLILNQENAFR
ncbi:MAG: hypothetical protein ACJARL_003568 [Halopseudomonas sp.]|jgi:hypothetical protein